MGPYSMDLRQRVAEAVENKEGSLRNLARRFCVSVTFITRLVGLRRQTGAPRDEAKILVKDIAEWSAIMQDEICRILPFLGEDRDG